MDTQEIEDLHMDGERDPFGLAPIKPECGADWQLLWGLREKGFTEEYRKELNDRMDLGS